MYYGTAVERPEDQDQCSDLARPSAMLTSSSQRTSRRHATVAPAPDRSFTRAAFFRDNMPAHSNSGHVRRTRKNLPQGS